MSRCRRARRAVTAIALVVVLAGCDLSSPGYHEVSQDYGTCNDIVLTHMRNADARWQSGTADYRIGCNGVGSRLLYRWTNGEMYVNAWVWDDVSAWSINVGAVSSPAALHRMCNATFDCAEFEN